MGPRGNFKGDTGTLMGFVREVVVLTYVDEETIEIEGVVVVVDLVRFRWEATLGMDESMLVLKLQNGLKSFPQNTSIDLL